MFDGPLVPYPAHCGAGVLVGQFSRDIKGAATSYAVLTTGTHLSARWHGMTSHGMTSRTQAVLVSRRSPTLSVVVGATLMSMK